MLRTTNPRSFGAGYTKLSKKTILGTLEEFCGRSTHRRRTDYGHGRLEQQDERCGCLIFRAGNGGSYQGTTQLKSSNDMQPVTFRTYQQNIHLLSSSGYLRVLSSIWKTGRRSQRTASWYTRQIYFWIYPTGPSTPKCTSPQIRQSGKCTEVQ